MLIFGKSCSDWKAKAAYAVDKAANEFAEVREVRCEGITEVLPAFEVMAAFAADSKCIKFLYHATINLTPGERLTQEQWVQAVDRLEKDLKLTGHYRVVFEHINLKTAVDEASAFKIEGESTDFRDLEAASGSGQAGRRVQMSSL